MSGGADRRRCSAVLMPLPAADKPCILAPHLPWRAPAATRCCRLMLIWRRCSTRCACWPPCCPPPPAAAAAAVRQLVRAQPSWLPAAAAAVCSGQQQRPASRSGSASGTLHGSATRRWVGAAGDQASAGLDGNRCRPCLSHACAAILPPSPTSPGCQVLLPTSVERDVPEWFFQRVGGRWGGMGVGRRAVGGPAPAARRDGAQHLTRGPHCPPLLSALLPLPLRRRARSSRLRSWRPRGGASRSRC